MACGAVLLAGVAQAAETDETSLRLRLAWGGGARRQWHGRIAIDQGRFSELQCLGIESDEPGSMWIDGSALHIRQRSGRTYDGLDVLVTAAPSTTLALELVPADGTGQRFVTNLPLAQLADQFVNQPLDQQGNRLLVRRTPGDRLRLEFDDDTLIFEPGQLWRFRLIPQLTELARGTQLRLKARLAPAREGRTLWSAQTDYTVEPPNPKRPTVGVLIDLPLPESEGVYELTVIASQIRLGRLVPAKPLAQRNVQLVVLAPHGAPAHEDTADQWHEQLTIDPAHPNRWDQLLQWPQLKRIAGVPTGPLGSGHAQVWQSPLGPLVRLGPAPNVLDATWQAYPLAIRSVGGAHVLEVSYPSDVQQDLAISIVEPNATGQLMPIGLDSGVYVSAREGTPPQLCRHRLIFWPATRTPLVVLANRRPETTAVFGQIRVLAAAERLPRVPSSATPRTPTRLVAGYLDRPLFPENFAATNLLDPGIEQHVDDWQTFYDGASRLVDYLNFVGYNGLMMSVLADGSTIYPSKRLQPTPRYDTGTLATTGMDPVRKDGLELLLRMFDRAGLRLIPALQFAAPLPELEALRRRQQPRSTGIEWVGPDGGTWLERNRAYRGLAPYYNLLNPDVQRIMLAVVRELVERYAHHAAFDGLALQLTGFGYAQLPGPEWGLDDATIARFRRDTGIEVPMEGANRFADRAAVLLAAQRKDWLRWRAGEVASFYDRLQREVAAVRPGARLYLAAAEMFEQHAVQCQLRPALPRRSKVLAAMLELGIQPDLLRDHPQIVLLRPNLIASPRPLAARAVDMTINSDLQLDRQLAATPWPGSLQFHRPERTVLCPPDRQSPFGKDSAYTSLLSQPSPSQAENRRRFTRSLALLDTRALFDGGYVLPLGQEDTLRDWIQVYQQLPADQYQSSTIYRQPVTIRTLSQAEDTWIYLVNDSPWPAQVVLPLKAPDHCQMTELGPAATRQPPVRVADGLVWEASVDAYGLIAAHLSTAEVTVHDPRVDVGAEIKGQLDRRIQDLSARAASLHMQAPHDVLKNPGFELVVDGQALPGWELIAAGPGASAQIDPKTSHQDGHSVRLDSAGTASLRSEPFTVPKTGRLALRVWVRVADTQQQPILRMAIEGPAAGQSYFRFGTAGGDQPGARPLTAQWKEYVVPFDDLPSGQISQIRIRFDLVGAGTVWLDDIRLDRFYFDDIAQRDLAKIIVSASQRLQNDQLSDCLRLLEGYWPRFLVENVPVVERPVAAQQPPTPARKTGQARKPAEQPGMARRLKNLVPSFLRFY